MDEKKTSPQNDSFRMLTLDEMSMISGGVDYSAEYPTFSAICSRYYELMKEGLSEDESRVKTKQEYMGQVLDICYRYPEANVSAEEQASVIFAMLIGS